MTVIAVLVTTFICNYTCQRFGLEAMLILFVTVSGAIWGWVIRWLYVAGKLTVSHIIVIWMVWTGTVLGGVSYYLAFMGITDNLETLSRYIMVELVAGVGGYFVKGGVENALKIMGTNKLDRDAQKIEAAKELGDPPPDL